MSDQHENHASTIRENRTRSIAMVRLLRPCRSNRCLRHNLADVGEVSQALTQFCLTVRKVSRGCAMAGKYNVSWAGCLVHDAHF
jgi:hypothetical protein